MEKFDFEDAGFDLPFFGVFDITGLSMAEIVNVIDSNVNEIDVKDELVLIKLKGVIKKGNKTRLEVGVIEDLLKKKGALFVSVNDKRKEKKEEKYERVTKSSKTEDIEREIVDYLINDNSFANNQQTLNNLILTKQIIFLS